MNAKPVKIIIPGALATDIVVFGLPHLPKPGEDSYGQRLYIGGGGKSRNIADMAGNLTEPGTVAMVSYTTRDQFGLWKPPYESLERAGVNLEFVTISDNADQYPAIALVSVDSEGNRNASISNGIVANLTSELIDNASQLFESAANNNGLLVLSMEIPFETAVHTIKRANDYKLNILLDPGGLSVDADYELLLRHGLYLIKPNEHEAKQLTGITVKDFETAEKAAHILQEKGARNVLITHGTHGAYFFGENIREHINTPHVSLKGETDATGCGDQTLAAITAYLVAGKSLHEAAQIGVVAGTLQFHKPGIQPITRTELEKLIAV